MTEDTTPAPDSGKRRLRPVRTLFSGMLAALPLLGTLWLLSLAIDFLLKWFGPESRTGRVLEMLGVSVSGGDWPGYLIGLAIAVSMLFALGLLVERGLATWLGWLVDAVVGRIPVVRTIYETLEKFVSVFAQRDRKKMQSMRPVWCRFGESGDVAALGLLSSPTPIFVEGRACYAVIIPTAPVPIGGGLLFMPVEWVTPADIGMDAVTSIYVSLGVTAPQFLSIPPGAPPPREQD